jgi:ribosomal-protein-alanine N-acetyltransferase
MTSRDESVFSWIQDMLHMRILETERLVLRQFCQDDLKDINTWEEAADEQYTELQAQSLLDFCFQSYRKWGMGPWGMLLKKDGIMVGACGFCRIDFEHNCGEVNYHVTRQYRRQGLASEALKAVLKFGFEDIGLARIQARCGPDNESSERVMQKAGMKFERMISTEISKDAFRDEKLYAIMRNP